MTKVVDPELLEHFPTGEEPFSPRYDLTEEELRQLEAEMVTNIRSVTDADFCAAWISPLNRFSNFLRTKEAEHFPEVGDVDPYYENHQLYLALVDLRGEGKIVHGASITFFDNAQTPDNLPVRTGLYTIDSLIDRGNFTKEEFVEYYKKAGVDIESSVSVETNFRIGDKTDSYWGLGTADLTYLTIVNMLIERGMRREGTIVLATMNQLQANSLSRAGIKYSNLMGRVDFDTEEAELGKVSYPVAIDFSTAYDALAPLGMKLPEVHYR